MHDCAAMDSYCVHYDASNMSKHGNLILYAKFHLQAIILFDHHKNTPGFGKSVHATGFFAIKLFYCVILKSSICTCASKMCE